MVPLTFPCGQSLSLGNGGGDVGRVGACMYTSGQMGVILGG